MERNDVTHFAIFGDDDLPSSVPSYPKSLHDILRQNDAGSYIIYFRVQDDVKESPDSNSGAIHRCSARKTTIDIAKLLLSRWWPCHCSGHQLWTFAGVGQACSDTQTTIQQRRVGLRQTLAGPGWVARSCSPAALIDVPEPLLVHPETGIAAAWRRRTARRSEINDG